MNLATLRSRVAAAFFAAVFAASSASAALLATNNFETAYDGFSSSADLSTLVSLEAYESGGQPSDPAPAPFSGFGSKYLQVDSGAATVWRTFAEKSSDVYFDSFVQMEPSASAVSWSSDAKLVMFLDAETNLCVVSGTDATDRTAVTNVLDVAIEAGSWRRLTIKAIAGDVYSFNVYIDGIMRQTAGSDPVSTFYSLVAGTSVSQIGFMGEGALDDMVVRTTAPVFDGDVGATVNGEDFATLEDALAAADGATVTLAADHAAPILATASGSYSVAPGSYAFGGIVGKGGTFVSSSTSDGVTTYTVVAPAVVWDGAASQYDFSTLTRVNGDNTYTMNINEMNTVDDNHSFVRIGDENAKKAVTITAVNSDPSITNAFGTAGQISVIMKSRGLALEDNSARGLIGVMDGNLYRSNDNGVKVGSATRNKTALAVFWNGYYYNQQTSPSPALSTGEQRHAFAYDSTSAGAIAYLDGTRVYSNNGAVDANFKVPTGIILGGVDTDGSGMMYAQCGLEIEAVAVFAAKLTDAQIASYVFPSEIDPDIDPGATISVAVDTPVSTINSLLPGKAEIWVLADDGVTITGDTTFTAVKVHFVSAGEVIVTPPADNAAEFDFSKTANPVVAYSGAAPTQSGNVFTSTTIPTWITDSSKWTGTLKLEYVVITDFDPNYFGNELSTLRAKGIYTYFKSSSTPLVCLPTIELETYPGLYGMNVYNGYSRDSSNPDRIIVINKLKGDGALWTGDYADTVLINVRDWSEYTGRLQIVNKIVVLGDFVPPIGTFNASGSIYVGTNETAVIRSQWRADGGIHVHGTLKAPGVGTDWLRSGTVVRTYDSGVFVLTSTGNGDEAETAVSYSSITGTGTLKYEGAGWRALSSKNFPTTMTLENEQAGNLLLSRAGTYTVGSFAGTKNIEGNYGVAAAYRYLRVLQAKDTEWSGTIKEDKAYGADAARFKGLIVAPGTGSSPTGTLTLSGTQIQKAALTVESGAKVNLTGTWIGPVTVAGTFGGAGTVTGDVTFSRGATLDASNGALEASGDVSLSGFITVRLSSAGQATILTTTGGTITANDVRVRVFVGDERCGNMSVVVDGNALKLVNRGTMLRLH